MKPKTVFVVCLKPFRNNPQVRQAIYEAKKAVFEAKKEINDAKLVRGEIQGAQEAKGSVKECLERLNAQEEAEFHNMGNQTHAAFLQHVKPEVRPTVDYNGHGYMQTAEFWQDKHNARVAEIMDNSCIDGSIAASKAYKSIKKLCDKNPHLKKFIKDSRANERAEMTKDLVHGPKLDVVIADDGVIRTTEHLHTPNNEPCYLTRRLTPNEMDKVIARIDEKSTLNVSDRSLTPKELDKYAQKAERTSIIDFSNRGVNFQFKYQGNTFTVKDGKIVKCINQNGESFELANCLPQFTEEVNQTFASLKQAFLKDSVFTRKFHQLA